MATTKYKVGTEIEAYCKDCDEDRSGVIETLKSDGNINRVVCNTCKESHLFRRPKSAAAKKPKSRRRIKGAVLVAEEDLASAKPYSMAAIFEVGDIIQHKAFGAGSVVEIRNNGKMQVGFETGPKLLVFGRK
ncbi:MAG: hypothetical protein OES25_09695 [Acidobacteriota bacterium]|nr:hypothetical protein [Acidobacteriota bacterium]